MNSSSHAVKYESAAALMSITAAPTAVKGTTRGATASAENHSRV